MSGYPSTWLSQPVGPDDYARMMAAVQRHGAAERRCDIVGTMATMTEDCYQEHPALGLRCAGQSDVATYYQQSMFIPFPDHSAETYGMAAGPNHLLLSTRLFGQMRGPWMGLPSTGREFSYPVVVIVELRDDKLVGETWLYDAMTVCKQLGLPYTNLLAAARALSSAS